MLPSVGVANRAKPEGDATAAAVCFAHAGRRGLDAAAGTVTLDIGLAPVPNWVGQRQLRFARLEDDALVLSGRPILILGEVRTAYLTWRRLTCKQA